METVYRIVILPRGWVYVGEFHQEGTQCRLENAFNIRYWGTSRGLGELAEGGPTDKTKLDPAGTVRFHEGAIIATLDTVVEKWRK